MVVGYQIRQIDLMTKRLEGMVAVITGASSGIGAGTVYRFVEEGASVIAADIQEEAGEALAEEFGKSVVFIKTDVTQEEQVAAAVDLAVEKFGRLDCMFNNAGIVGVVGPIADTPTEDWDTTIAILLKGVFLGCKHAARVMIPQGSGSIISTSSTAGILGGLGSHAYTAAKHGVIGLAKSVASELSEHGVRSNAIAPGNTVTAMTATVTTGDHKKLEETAEGMASRSMLGIAGQPEDIAAAAAYLASNDARLVNGHVLVVDGGQTTSGGNNRFIKSGPGMLREAGKWDRY
jgi:NAD(P)-dependent dehydrogenase (short-subunit alcohol dehydrogenase family)